MKTTTTIKETVNEILRILENISGSEYFYFEYEGEKIKIRVSDHSANYSNNNGEKTFSFCTNYVRQNGYGRGNMINEWIVDNNGFSNDYGKNVEEIIDFELS